MSESFIQIASNALNTAWSQGSSLVVDCAPLTDALTSLSLTIGALSQEVAALREQNDTLRTQQAAQLAEINALRARVDSATGVVAGLADASTGMVPRPEFVAEFAQAKWDADLRAKEVMDVVTAKLGTVARISTEDRERVLALSDAADAIRTTSAEAFNGMRQQVAATESQLRGLNADRAAQHLKLAQRHEDDMAAVAQAAAELRGELVERGDRAAAAATHALTRHVDELLQGLDAQARRVDALQRTGAARDGEAPTRSEVARLVAALDDARFAVEESQLRQQETFAQCMALLESAAGRSASAHGGGGGASGPRPRGASSVHAATPTAQHSGNSQPQQQPANNGGGGGGDGAPSHALSFVESRLDHVQALAERVVHEELPFLAADAKARHDDHVVLVQAQKRAYLLEL